MEELQDLLLCEIRRIAVLKSYDTDPYSSRIRTYPDVPCSKTRDVSTECQELYSFRFGLNPWHGKSDVRIPIETRRVETRKFPYAFRFVANNGVPYTSARSVKLRLFFRVFLKIVFSTLRTVSLGILVPKFHGTRRIDLHSGTRFSSFFPTIRRESLSIQEPEIPRY